MVEKQIAERGVEHQAVLDAMRAVPREMFVPEARSISPYEDRPLGIEAGQTISQPYVVALMAAALELSPRDRVLEIGAAPAMPRPFSPRGGRKSTPSSGTPCWSSWPAAE